MKHEEKQVFFSEMLDVTSSISGPWIILGDFNLVRDPSEKNSTSFDGQEAQHFNDLIPSFGWLCLHFEQQTRFF